MATKNTRIALTKADLQTSLERHLRLLMSACTQYDEGMVDAGMYIAVTLRVLLHHNPKGASKSLLEQLGLRSGHRFYTTAEPYNPKNLLDTCNLASMLMGPQGAQYVPMLSDGPFKAKKIPFVDWWGDIVLVDSRRNKMARRDLVSHVANTEAAHVDSALDEAYMDLSRNNSLGWRFNNGDVDLALPGPQLACMRQIAHEVLITLQEKLPTGLPSPYSPRSMMERVRTGEVIPQT
jgi:hypothetical protein